MNRREWLLLSGVIALAFCVRVFFLSRVRVVLPDEAYYIQMAENMAYGREFGAFGAVIKGQPLFPFLVSLFIRWGVDPARAGGWISVIFGVLTLIPFHLCVRHWASEREAAGSDLIYALSPFAIRYSFWAMTHSVFIFLYVLLFLFFLKSRRNPAWVGALLGMAAAFLYLTRVEGIILSGLLFLILWAGNRGSLPAFSGVFSLIGLPFWIWVRKETGVWQVTWIEASGASGLLAAWTSVSPAVAAGSLIQKASAYFYNIVRLQTFLPQIFPLIGWILGTFGMVKVLSHERASVLWGILLFAGFPFLFYPAIALEPRMFYPALVFLALFAGPGIEFLRERRIPAALIFFLLFLGFVPGYRNVWAESAEEPLEIRRAGEWIRKEMPEPAGILSSDIRTCFYAGPRCGKFLTMKAAERLLESGKSFEDILREKSVTLVVADSRYIPKFYPRFSFLFSEEYRNSHPFLAVLSAADREGIHTVTISPSQ